MALEKSKGIWRLRRLKKLLENFSNWGYNVFMGAVCPQLLKFNNEKQIMLKAYDEYDLLRSKMQSRKDKP